MIVDYSKEDGLLSATRDTFSGERPCHLCHRISEAKENDDSKPTPLTAPDHSRLLQDMLPSRTASVPPPLSHPLPPVLFTGPTRILGLPVDSPPLPPPRSIVA
jgi:hypothetical protein